MVSFALHTETTSFILPSSEVWHREDLRDMSRRFQTVFASIFRTVSGEESISEVRILIGKVHPIDLFIIRMAISRRGWYSSHSQCLVFFKGSSTLISLRRLLMRVRCHTRRPLVNAYHTSRPASFTIQTCLMMIRHPLLSTFTFSIRILFRVSEARPCS